jgi:hypothetical protein
VRRCDDLDGASRRDKAKNLKLWKRKDEAPRIEKLLHHEQSPEEGITHLDETIIIIMLCLSFTKLN